MTFDVLAAMRRFFRNLFTSPATIAQEQQRRRLWNLQRAQDEYVRNFEELR